MEDSTEPVYLVDGSGYIFRAFYAVQPLSNSKGLPTNAIFGFARMINKLLRDIQAHYIAVVFDTGKPTFRHRMYEQYKANRKECPAELVPQMPYFRKTVQAFNVLCLEKEGFEADDIIATLTKQFSSVGRKVVIVSGDKDLTQLVGGDVTVWDAMRDIRYDRDTVIGKFGVPPEQIADYLTLTGDSSDNVPGVKGIGPKGAVQLLQHFGSVEAMVSRASETATIKGLRGAASLQEKIESSIEVIQISKKLVTLDEKVDLRAELGASLSDGGVFEEKALQRFHWVEPNIELLSDLMTELEFTLPVAGVGAKPKASDTPTKWFSLVTPETLDDVCEKLASQKEFAFDTETSGLDSLGSDLVGISVSWKEGEAYFFPLGHVLEAQRNLDRGAVLERLGPIFANPHIKKIGLNLKYDVEVLESHGYTVKGIAFDDMLASYVLNPDKRQHGLKALTKIHLGEEMTTFDQLVGKAESIAHVPLDSVVQYACHDAEASFNLKNRLQPLLAGDSDLSLDPEYPSPRYVFEKIEMPLVRVLCDIERAGIAVDLELLQKLSEQFGAEIKILEARIHQLAGKEFNINSPKQLSTILFEDLGLPTAGVKRTQTAYSTDADVLSKLAEEHEIAQALLEYRELFKLNSTYVEALKGLIDEKTGRIHGTFNQAVAATGRLSSSDPNLQNIPIRNARGRQIRDAFIAAPGYVLISADYSQVELRVLAHLSGDESLCRAFERGEDIHLATARDIFGSMMTETELQDLRRVAKTINFGVVYGMSAFRLAGDLGISRKQAQQYIDNYFARYPKVRGYLDSLASEGEKVGYVQTLFGRRRYLQDIDTSGRDAGYAGRSAMNAPIQGTAADIMKVAMITLHEALVSRETSPDPSKWRARIVLQVHDELLIEVRDEEKTQCAELVREKLENAVKLKVPLKVDVGIASRWGEAK